MLEMQQDFYGIPVLVFSRAQRSSCLRKMATSMRWDACPTFYRGISYSCASFHVCFFPIDFCYMLENPVSGGEWVWQDTKELKKI